MIDPSITDWQKFLTPHNAQRIVEMVHDYTMDVLLYIWFCVATKWGAMVLIEFVKRGKLDEGKKGTVTKGTKPGSNGPQP